MIYITAFNECIKLVEIITKISIVLNINAFSYKVFLCIQEISTVYFEERALVLASNIHEVATSWPWNYRTLNVWGFVEYYICHTFTLLSTDENINAIRERCVLWSSVLRAYTYFQKIDLELKLHSNNRKLRMHCTFQFFRW